MSLGLAVLTFVHVAFSLVGIGSGLVVLAGLLTSKRLDSWTALFLTTTVATSVSGFLFPFQHFLPSHAIGLVSLVVLAVAIPARYNFHMAAHWRRIYVASAMFALYLNVFVLVAQLFQKVPVLRAMAPTQSEPPFAIAQLLVFVLFLLAGGLAVIRFRIEPAMKETEPKHAHLGQPMVANLNAQAK